MTHPTTTGTVSPMLPGDWAADPAASTLTFVVRNFGLRTVTGQIPLTSAVIHVGPGGQPVSIRAELDARGIDTGNRRRDKDLRGRRFLATGQWPAITFEAHYIQPNETGWTISGTLTVKGAHCPVRLQVAGPATPARADRADLHATGRIPWTRMDSPHRPRNAQAKGPIGTRCGQQPGTARPPCGWSGATLPAGPAPVR